MNGQENNEDLLNQEADTAAGTQEVKPPTSPLDRMKTMDRFKEKEYESPEQALEDALNALEEISPKSEEGEKMKNDLLELFKKHPEIPYMLKIAEETGDFHVAIQSLYDNSEDMLMKEGDEGYDKLSQLRKDRIDKANTEKELLDKYNSNMESFPQKFDQWAEARKLSNEDKEGMYALLDDMLMKLVSGDIDEDVLDKMYQAYSYKRDIGELEEDNAVAEANAENANQKESKPIMPVPEGVSPAGSIAPKEKIDPLTEIYNAQRN